MASLLDLFSGGPGQAVAGKTARVTRKAVKQQMAEAEKGAAQQRADLTQYQQKAISTAGEGLPAWQQIFAQGTSPVNTFYGALGVPGYDAAAAQQAWQSSIPYEQFTGLVPQIQEAALRRGGSTGQTGAVQPDMMARLMQSLNQFYPGWLGGLQQGFGQETAGATGQQGVFNTQAGLQSGLGTGLSNIDQWLAGANIAGYGDIGKANATRLSQAFGANQQAGKNQLDAIIAAVNAATSIFGGGGTGAKPAFTGLNKLFGGTGMGSDYAPDWNTVTSNEYGAAL